MFKSLRKLYCILTIVLGCPIFTHAQNLIRVEEKWYEDGRPEVVKWYNDVQDSSHLAKVEHFDEQGGKTLEGTFTEGLPEGKFTEWQYGKIKTVYFYKSGKLNGPSIVFAGNVRDTVSVHNYADDNLHGRVVFWSYGKKTMQLFYKNGLPEGTQLGWYESTGQMQFKYFFKNGNPDGKQYWWAQGQTTPRTEEWKDGKLQTEHKWELPEGGKIRAVMSWVFHTPINQEDFNSKRYLSKLITFWNDSSVRSITHFDSQYYEAFYPDGKSKCNGYGNATKKMGNWAFWYANGKQLAEGSYAENPDTAKEENPCLKSIVCQVFAEGPASGLPEEVRTYIEEKEPGELNSGFRVYEGRWMYYNDSGKPVLEVGYGNRMSKVDYGSFTTTYSYWPNGNIRTIDNNGDSNWTKEYFNRGGLKSEKFALQKGSEDFGFKLYYPDGQVKETGTLQGENQKQGAWLYYDNRGKLYKRAFYTDGKTDSLYVWIYDSTGFLISQGSLNTTGSNYNKDGNWIYFHPDGSTKRTEVYAPGVFSGNRPMVVNMLEYDISGRIVAKGTDAKVTYYEYHSDSQILKETVKIFPDKSRDLFEYYVDTGRGTILRNTLSTYKNGNGYDIVRRFDDSGYIQSAIRYYPNGKVKFKLNFCTDCFVTPDSVKQALIEKWNCGGCIGLQAELDKAAIRQKNLYHGKLEGWFEDGQPWFIADMQNGLPIGELKEFYADGRTRMHLKFCSTEKGIPGFACSEELYFMDNGRELRHEGGYTEESMKQYNLSRNRSDLRRKRRSDRIATVVGDSFLNKLVDFEL